MWGKLLTVLVVTGIIGSVTFLGWRVVIAYGDARYSAGKSDAQLAAVPGIIKANERAMAAGLAGRDQVIASQTAALAEMGRLSSLFAISTKKWTDYAQTADGRALCVDPERVLGVETDRTAAFLPSAPAEGAGGAEGGSVPSDATAEGQGRQP